MVREAREAEGHARKSYENGFAGTALVRLSDTERKLSLKDRVAALRSREDAAKEFKQPWFQVIPIQYLGNKKWRLGLVPIDGSKAQWIEGLPYEEVLKQVESLKGRIKRVDHTSKEYRNYE